jgi:hypothetical protein
VREGGEFVNETLGCEGSVRVSHRSPPLNRNVHFRLVILDRQVRNGVRQIVGALDGCGIVSLLGHHALERCSRKYRLTHETRSPTHGVAAGIDATGNGVDEGRTIPTA